MVSINSDALTNLFERYLISPEIVLSRMGNIWGFKRCMDETLLSTDSSVTYPDRPAITFGHNSLLVANVLLHAYRRLTEEVSTNKFASEMADAICNFAQQFPHGELCYPHFLLHGVAKPTLEGVVSKIDSNSRIIRETREIRDKTIQLQGYKDIGHGLKLVMANGCTDDFFGIAYLLARKDEISVSSAVGYVAKTSFFLDRTKRDVYVVTIQGRRFGSHDPVRKTHPSEVEKRKAKERIYSRIGNIFGMNPRRYVLTQVMEFGRQRGYARIRVIKPKEHLFAFENHKGFHGNYEPLVRKAGINTESEVYLETRL